MMVDGITDIKMISAGLYHAMVVTNQGTLFGFGANQHGNLGCWAGTRGNITPRQIPFADEDVNAVQVSCGANHNLVLDKKGQVWAFGSNSSGQLGLDTFNQVVSRPTIIDGLPPITNVWCGADSSYVKDSDSNIWVFGANEQGELGLGDYPHVYSLKLISSTCLIESFVRGSNSSKKTCAQFSVRRNF
jgi:hypothetical protein